MTIYDDHLSVGWSDWSWDATTNYSITAPVKTGIRSLGVSLNQPWAGLNLHHANMSTAGITALEFEIHGGATGGQQLIVIAKDGMTTSLPHVALDDYLVGGSVGANEWRTVCIPLSALGVNASGFTGLIIQDGIGSSQPVFYLDTIRLLGTS